MPNGVEIRPMTNLKVDGGRGVSWTPSPEKQMGDGRTLSEYTTQRDNEALETSREISGRMDEQYLTTPSRDKV